ncbi:hypothetical protein DH2020_017481 [Rehmannia glutinosa]|uniref:MLO-like protein n=1 Tax=Rehmannia glutinosa TaxID=99300 RepID=A0ABR0WTP7_REHGL
MGGDSGEESATTLEHTATWAVATVCFILIAVSILIEHGLHLLAKYFGRKKKISIIHALNKIKSDLMLLGFISLLLTVCERPIANICIPKGVSESFLPCQSLTSDEKEEESKCHEQGKVSLMSRLGVQQLQMLIFFLAFFHVLSSFLTFSLGTAKIQGGSNSLIKHPLEGDILNSGVNIDCYVNFLRQFFGSVYKVDYFTLRHGFITAHFAEGSNFDFQKFLKRALEKDFQVVVGMRISQLCLAALHPITDATGGWDKATRTPFSWHSSHGLGSCFHRETEDIVIKLAMGVVIPILCGYVTLPLYALVTQMGTSMGNSVFPEGVVGGLKRWRAKARRNLATRKRRLAQRSLDASVESSPSFSTLDDGVEWIGRLDEENVAERRPEQHQKLGSFEGFELSRV